MRENDENRALIERLKRIGVLTGPRVEKAMLAVPRHLFVPPALRDEAYVDAPLPIGMGQTISAPHMVAIMTELLDVRPGHRVLEIGTGSGYQAAILAHLVGDTGKVYTVERIPELAEQARERFRTLGLDKRIEVVVGDGSRGLPEHAPYDRILVTCGAPRIPPPLLEQIGDGGKILVPEGGRYYQQLAVYTFEKGRLKRKVVEDVMFVPLVGEYGWEG